jgi:CheY-like chemotaxis protein
MVVGRAGDGTEAMEALCAADTRGWQFDAVVFDVDIRCARGMGLARTIRDDPRLAAVRLVRVVPLNASESATGGDETRVDGEIAKPVKLRSVHRCMESALESGSSKVARSALNVPAVVESHADIPCQAISVLVAEDSAVNQKVVQFQLRKLGCKVDCVADGEAAALAVRMKSYDVILMDCQMPKLDGWETARRIREYEKGRKHRTWIIAMTAHSLVGDRERCMEAGMDDYLSKPVRFGDLGAALGQSPAARRAVAADATAVAENVVCQERLSGFRQLEAESGQTVLVSVIDLFIERTPPMFKEARRAAKSKDSARLARLAHTMKGSCSNFGAQRMLAACERLEAAALGDDSGSGMEGMLDEIEREFGFVRTALENELEVKSA